jgi:magnesium-transporting ATPase (P-type)
MGVTVFAVLLSRKSNLTNQITSSAKLNHSISIGPNVANDIWSKEFALAYRQLDLNGEDKSSKLTTKSTEEDFTNALNAPNSTLEQNLIFLGFFGIEDPLRDGVQVAVKRLKGAGLRVMMVTGDNLVTAQTIAYQAGILPTKIRTCYNSR